LNRAAGRPRNANHEISQSPDHQLVLIEKRRSPIQGWGVFATRPITKNTRIIDYAGEKIPNRESLKRERRYLKKGHIWCFKLNRLCVRDAAVGGNVARYINHASTTLRIAAIASLVGYAILLIFIALAIGHCRDALGQTTDAASMGVWSASL
jgi:hypothetical protein